MTQAQQARLMEEQELSLEQEMDDETRDFTQNQISLTFSWSLMNQLRYMARTEGIPVEDLLVELTAEGVAKRVFEDQNRPTPSHLMTRNGYVHDGDSQTAPQPQMSHHNNMNSNRAQNHNPNGRAGKYNYGQRGNQANTFNKNQNNSYNNRNYQGNNRSNQQNFRSNPNNNSYNGISRFSRNANNQGNNQNSANYDEGNNPQYLTQVPQKDTSKR